MFTFSRKVHSVLLVVVLLLLANIHHINAQTNSISNSSSNSGSSSEDASTEPPTVDVVLDDGDEDTTTDTDTSTSISDSTDEDTTNDSTENDDEDGTSLTDNSVSDSVDDSDDGDDEDTTTNNGSDSTDTSDDGSGTDTNGSDSDSGDDSDDDTTTITQEDAERCQGSITTKPCDCLTNMQCGQRDDCGLQQGCLSNEEISENRLVSNGAATSNEAAASDEMWAAIGGSTGGLLLLGLALGGFYLYRKRKNLNEETGTKVGKSMSLQPSEQANLQDPENPTPMSDNAMSPQRPLPPRPPMSPDGHPMGVMGHTGVAMPMGSGMNKEIKQEKWRDDETEVDGIEETAASHSKQGIVRPMSSTNGSRHTSITSRQAEEEKAQEL